MYVTGVYYYLEKSCCDPFNVHSKVINKSSHVVSKTTRKRASTIHGIKMNPGSKLCTDCYKKISKPPGLPSVRVDNITCEIVSNVEGQPQQGHSGTTQLDTFGGTEADLELEVLSSGDTCSNSNNNSTSSSSSSSTVSEYEPRDVVSYDNNLNQSLRSLGLSPLKAKKIGKRSKLVFGKHKLSQASTSISKKICTNLGLSETEMEHHNNFEEAVISDVKAKLIVSKKNDQIKLLSIIPDFWSLKKIANVFNVSIRLARKARKLKREQGILPNTEEKKTGNRVSEEVVQKVKDFYQEDDISRMCPGMRENIIVKLNGEKITKQKRLMLINLKDAFQAFKEKEPNVKIGLSTFCALKPVWCICASTHGMHNVCVCKIHQNAKLMINALPEPSLTLNDFMSCLVCDTENFSCMIHRCEDCPGNTSLENLIQNILQKHDIDAEDNLNFKQWVSTDNTYLASVTLSSTEFVQQLIAGINNLTKHHFTTKSQSKFYKDSKENLNEETALVVLDFSENYSFVVQDAVQGFHWNNAQATLHPFCIYYKENDEIKVLSICIISDHASHDAIVVRAFLEEVIKIIKSKLPKIKHLIYFSDGASSQYKNCKNLSNLCHHKQDFALTAEWHFFATSHGKGPCDGIGGVLKKLVTRASLQRPLENQILTPIDFFEWAKHNVKGIAVVYVPTELVKELQSKFHERMEHAKTVKGTRSFHAFIPVGTDTLKCALFSNSSDWQMRKIMSVSGTSTYIYTVGSYVACIYGKEWWLGLINEICDDSDYNIKFLHPSGSVTPSNSFYWPQHEDICFIPAENVLCPLSPSTVTGRTYFISEAERDIIKNLFFFSKK